MKKSLWALTSCAVMFIMLWKEAVTFESVNKIIKCDHWNESYWAVHSCVTVYYAVQGGSNLWVCSVTIQMKATEQYFLEVLFVVFYKVIQTFELVGQWNPKVWPFKRNLLSNTSLPVLQRSVFTNSQIWEWNCFPLPDCQATTNAAGKRPVIVQYSVRAHSLTDNYPGY